jgi:hypothetical protein
VPWRCDRHLWEIDENTDLMLFPLAWRRFSDLTGMDRDAAEVWLEDQCKQWRFRGFFRRSVLGTSTFGTEETYLSRLCRLTRDEFRQLLLLKKEVKDAAGHWLNEQAAEDADKEAERKPAAPVSSRGFGRQDAPLVQEMREHIVAERADVPWAATALVVDRAAGGGNEDSKRKRLLGRFLQTFPEFRTEKV